MILKRDEAKRLLIYFFYDANGIVDDYIPYMLDDLKKNVTDIQVVVNGKINDEGIEKFKRYTDKVLIRENKGFDVWAYKEAMESLGWEKVDSYDELILMNFTVMGPLYPFSEMFDTMDAKDIDFWGITQFYEIDEDPFGTMPDGIIPDHIQSHFIAVRKSLIQTEDFHKYWDEMPMITGYIDSVSRHEARFTKYFEKLGYSWDVYTDASDYIGLSHQPVVAMAYKMVAEKRCPIFKRRSFMQDYNVVLNESCGQEAFMLYDFIDKHTDYDVNLIWDNLLRVENQADLKKNFQWNYILSHTTSKCPGIAAGKRIALVIHIHFIDLVDECRDYAMAMPENTDIYVTTNTEEKKQAIIEAFSKVKCNKLDVRLVGNKGRDVGPFLVEFKDYLDDYDYVCHVHDKKAGQTKPGTVGLSFAYKCFENVLKSREFVENVIATFEENPRAGILAPPPPNHADYFITLGLEWGANYGNTVELAKKLGINVSIKEDKEPIAPLGSFFWARAKALKPLFDKGWKYDDFPEEPIPDDGTILHAIERIYPFSAQSAGYYPGWIMCEDGAAMEITNLNHMVKELNKIIFFKGMDAGSYHRTLYNLSRSYDMLNEFKARKGNTASLESKLYYSDAQHDFNEGMSKVHGPCGNIDGANVYDFRYRTSVDMNMIRFDPCEHGQVMVKKADVEVTLSNGSTINFTHKDAVHNGLNINNDIVFLRDDPQLIFKLGETKHVTGIKVILSMDGIDDAHMAEVQNRANRKGRYLRKLGLKK